MFSTFKVMKMFIYLLWGNLVMLFYKITNGSNVQYSPLIFISPRSSIIVHRGGKIRFGKFVRIGKGNLLSVLPDGVLELGNRVVLTSNGVFVAHQSLKIGANSLIANTHVYDHDHNYKIGIRSKKYVKGNVEIGENVWTGVNVVILRNTKIGDNCVIGAGSVIKGDFPSNHIIVQKRENQLIPMKQ